MRIITVEEHFQYPEAVARVLELSGPHPAAPDAGFAAFRIAPEAISGFLNEVGDAKGADQWNVPEVIGDPLDVFRTTNKSDERNVPEKTYSPDRHMRHGNGFAGWDAATQRA